MAVRRGYVRGSGGFLQPVGRLPSGRVSGPRAGTTVGLTAAQLPLPGKVREAEKKVLASYQKAQKQHEAVMAKIAAAETSRVDKIQKALESERKNAPKDKLGNTIETPLAKYLAGQLGIALGQYSQRGKALTPGGAGITREQQEAIRTEGPGRPEIGGAFEPIPGAPTPGAGPGPLGPRSVPGTSMEPGAPGERTQMFQPKVYPMNTQATHVSGQTITLLGQQRMGPKGPEYLARSAEGVENWVPASNFEVAEEARGPGALERYFEHRKPVPEFQPF